MDEFRGASGTPVPAPEFVPAHGCDGVAVADTALTLVDGEVGQQILRGIDMERLAGHVPDDAVCHLLWTGALPNEGQLERLRAELARARAFARLGEIGDALEAHDGMAALRAALAHLL